MIQPIHYGRQQTLLSQRLSFGQPIRWRDCQGDPTKILGGCTGTGTLMRQSRPSQMITKLDLLSTPRDMHCISSFY